MEWFIDIEQRIDSRSKFLWDVTWEVNTKDMAAKCQYIVKSDFCLFYVTHPSLCTSVSSAAISYHDI